MTHASLSPSLSLWTDGGLRGSAGSCLGRTMRKEIFTCDICNTECDKEDILGVLIRPSSVGVSLIDSHEDVFCNTQNHVCVDCVRAIRESRVRKPQPVN